MLCADCRVPGTASPALETVVLLSALLTRGTGRVRAVARGVRRTRSRNGARQEPFSHVDLRLAEGREILDSTRLHRRTRLYEAMSDWTPAERAEFGRLLERFNAAVDRLGQEP
jgi:hypothetical protein